MAEVINLEKLIGKLNKLSNQQMDQALNKACILVENQAKENCPVDTGELRMSITHYVEGDTGVIGTNKQYAPYVELGSPTIKAHHMLQKAATEHTDEYKRLMEDSMKNA